MTGDDDENGPETDDPAEAGAFDPDVEIHAAMLARQRTGGACSSGTNTLTPPAEGLSGHFGLIGRWRGADRRR